MISTTIIAASAIFIFGVLAGIVIGAALVTWISRKTGMLP